MKKITLLLISIILIHWNSNGQIATAPSGTGASGDPYLIATLDNLYWVTQNPASWAKYFKQTANIDATSTSTWDSGNGFSPIGNGTTQFNGNYNGQGYAISNLFINRPATDFIGLFGMGGAITLSNIILTNTNITGRNYVGALIGYGSSITASYCSSSGNLYGGIDGGLNGMIGGLLGYTGGGTISFSYSNCNVTGLKRAGGFLGASNNLNINCCYATGNVLINGTYNNTYAGGFSGEFDSSDNGIVLNNSYATGSVTNSSTGGLSYAGGFSGFEGGSTVVTVQNCYCTGAVSAVNTPRGFVARTLGSPVNTNCFFDTQTTGQAVAGNTGITGKTTTEMITTSTFTSAGWDFTGETTNGTNNYWDRVDGINSGYPTLIFSTTSNTTVAACDSYLWNGTTYTTSGDFIYHTTNYMGGDSAATLHLTINHSNTGTDVITACNSHTWINGITYTANNNTATHTLTNAAGCDSVVTLNLTINHSNTNSSSQFNFSIEGPITISNSAYDITVGDFNNSGRPEAIVTHAQNYNNTTPSSSNIVSYIKYNTASSVWESSIIENTGGYASLGITSGDYDSDGNRDFAFTSNCNCGNYYLYQGDGADGFTNNTPTFSGNRFSYDMTTGDLNNDGKPDIVTGGNTMLSKFLNTSSGVNNFSFNKASFVIASSDNAAYGYSLADFNGDGFKDIAAAVPAEAKVRVLLNDGAGGFNSAVYTDYNITGTSTSNIRGIATGDFNNDGYYDIVATSYNGNAIGVLINTATGTGTFNPVVIYPVTTPKWVEVGDFNADGILDIAVAASNVSVFSGNGDGTFSSTPYSYNLTGVNRLGVADMNSDGKDDIAVITSNSFSVLINTPEIITACDSYLWNGTTYTTSGDKIYTTTNVSGCDSVVTIHLVINHSNTGTDVISACDTYTWIDGVTYTTSNNTATKLLTNAVGCDSLATLNLTIKNSTTSSTTVAACDSYLWNGTTYTTSGDKTFHTLNAAGCDSAATLHLTINHSNTGTDVISACDSYTWIDGVTYTTSNNTATKLLTNAAGCDSLVTLNLTINHSNTGTDVISACDTYTWIDGITYTASNNTATKLLTNAAGCDSLVTLNLTIKNSTTSSTTVTACDSYLWNGTTYTTSGDKTFHTLNAVGCDSAATLHLTINHSNTGTDVISACDSYTWIDGATYTTSNNTATKLLTNAAGCDSLVTLNLTINHSNTGTDVISACDTYTWIDGITYTASNNTATKLLTNAAGCDSLVTLNLTIKNSTNSSTTIAACDSYLWNGTTYTTSGDKVFHTLNAVGCDSAATLHLTINHSNTGTDVKSACDTYTWIDGVTYTASNNTATKLLTNAAGCDSLVTLNLTINYSNTGTDVITACDTYTWIDGITYTASNNTATKLLTNAAGCDSLVTLNLTINYSNTGTDVITACNTYTWIDGITYTASNNTATKLLTNAAGCDSLVTLNLTINTVNVGVTLSGITITADASGLSYQWLDCSNYTPISGQTNQSYTPTANGSYAVEITDGECIDTSSCTTITNVGIYNNIILPTISVYPNPFSNELILDVKNNSSITNYEVLDALGQIVLKGSMSQSTTLHTAILNPGVYFIKLENGKNVIYKKAIKN